MAITACLHEHVFQCNDLVLLRTLREYQRAQARLSRTSVSAGIREQLDVAVREIEDELARRGLNMRTYDC